MLTHPKGSIYLLGGGAYGRACLRILDSRVCLRTLPVLTIGIVSDSVDGGLDSRAPAGPYITWC